MAAIVETTGPPGHGDDTIEEGEERADVDMDYEKQEVPSPVRRRLLRHLQIWSNLPEERDTRQACLRLMLALL